MRRKCTTAVRCKAHANENMVGIRHVPKLSWQRRYWTPGRSIEVCPHTQYRLGGKRSRTMCRSGWQRKRKSGCKATSRQYSRRGVIGNHVCVCQSLSPFHLTECSIVNPTARAAPSLSTGRRFVFTMKSGNVVTLVITTNSP
jgi:hypothetical protein